MKQFVKLVFVIITSLSVLNSCKDDSLDLKESSYAFEDFEIFGRKHNQGLENVFEDIKELGKSDSGFISLKEHLANEFIVNSIGNFAKSDPDLRSHAQGMKQNFERVSNQLGLPINSYTKSTNRDFSYFLNSSDLSAIQREFINKILSVNSEKVRDFETEIEKIIMEVDKSVASDEKIILYFTASIAVHSFSYWNENIDEWQALLDQSGLKSVEKGTWYWKKFWRSDVEGGVGGAIGGAITGGTITLGTLVVPSAVVGAVGGAIGTSAGNAVGQWLF